MEIALDEVLRLLNAPLSEEQLWAVCHGAAERLRGLVCEPAYRDLVVTLRSLQLTVEGLVAFQPLPLTTAEKGKYLPPSEQNEGGLRDQLWVFSLGATLFSAADFSLAEDEEPVFSEPFENLLGSMTEEDELIRHSLADILKETSRVPEAMNSTQIAQLYKVALGLRNKKAQGDEIVDGMSVEDEEFASKHRAHMRQILQNVLDGIVLKKIDIQELLKEKEARSLHLTPHECLMLSIRTAPPLTDVSQRVYVPSVAPPQLTPREVMLDDIRAQNYTLKHVPMQKLPITPKRAKQIEVNNGVPQAKRMSLAVVGLTDILTGWDPLTQVTLGFATEPLKLEALKDLNLDLSDLVVMPPSSDPSLDQNNENTNNLNTDVNSNSNNNHSSNNAADLPEHSGVLLEPSTQLSDEDALLHHMNIDSASPGSVPRHFVEAYPEESFNEPADRDSDSSEPIHSTPISSVRKPLSLSLQDPAVLGLRNGWGHGHSTDDQETVLANHEGFEDDYEYEHRRSSDQEPIINLNVSEHSSIMTEGVNTPQSSASNDSYSEGPKVGSQIKTLNLDKLNEAPSTPKRLPPLDRKMSRHLDEQTMSFYDFHHVRVQVTRAELDDLRYEEPDVYDALINRKLCFLCRKSKFGLLTRGCICSMCGKVVCQPCLTRVSLPKYLFERKVSYLKYPEYIQKLDATKPIPLCLKCKAEMGGVDTDPSSPIFHSQRHALSTPKA